MQSFFNPGKNLNFASDCLPQPCVPCNGNSQLECKFHHLQVNFSSTHHCFIAHLCIVILIIIPSFVGHTFRSEFLLLTKCQKTAFESRRPSRDTVITLHHCEQVTCLFWCYSCWTLLVIWGPQFKILRNKRRGWKELWLMRRRKQRCWKLFEENQKHLTSAGNI